MESVAFDSDKGVVGFSLLHVISSTILWKRANIFQTRSLSVCQILYKDRRKANTKENRLNQEISRLKKTAIVSQTTSYGPVGMEEWSLRVSEPPTDRRNGGMVGYSVPKVHRNGGIVINLAIYPPTNRRNGGMVLSYLPPYGS